LSVNVIPVHVFAGHPHLCELKLPDELVISPPPQAVHVPPDPYELVLQMQFTMVEDPSTDVEKLGHVVHALTPSKLEYVPAVQFLHMVTELAPTVFE
jgi:hypothetical protein